MAESRSPPDGPTTRADRHISGRTTNYQEPVDNRENIGVVRPEDYPIADRRDADATGARTARSRGNGSKAGAPDTERQRPRDVVSAWLSTD